MLLQSRIPPYVYHADLNDAIIESVAAARGHRILTANVRHFRRDLVIDLAKSSSAF